MNREQLAHILRAASTIVDDPNILVIGSQSVLATIDEEELPDAATASMEVDLAHFDNESTAALTPAAEASVTTRSVTNTPRDGATQLGTDETLRGR